MWLAISGLIGFVMGDFFLFNSYTLICSRSTQLFMTLGTPFAVIAGVFILNQQLSLLSMAGICVTLSGIFISILGRENNNEGEKSTIKLKLPVKGVIFGVMAALGQGIGLVFSKLGLNSYTESMAVNNASENTVMMMPFAASMIRTIAGLVGFFIIMLATNRLGSIGQAIKQRKTMAVASMGTFFGPFVGVSFSLIAVQYAPVGIASILTSLSPIFILLPYHFIYKQKITNIEVIGAFISIIGIGILFI